MQLTVCLWCGTPTDRMVMIQALGIFYLVIAMSGGAILAVLLIREEDIDHDLARGAWTQDGAAHIAGLGQLVADRRIAIFALAAVLFHFAKP